MPRYIKPSERWRNISFALLGVIVFAFWALSRVRTPSFEGKHEARHQVSRTSPNTINYGAVSESVSNNGIWQQSVTSTNRFRLLLSTHNRLLWYYPETKEEVTVHEGQGIYYGAFPGEPKGSDPTVWAVSRPHNWHPSTTEEKLLSINTNSGQLINSVKIPSRFTHDAIRAGNHVWLCNTGDGQLLQLAYPSMEVLRTMDLFTVKEHINTVAVFDSSSVWVVLHNLGRSAVVEVELASGQVLQRYDNVGMNCHGLVMWRGVFVLLSSKETSLITLNRSTKEITYIWSAEKGFLKGLTVVDDVAYFGISPPMERQHRDGPNVQCDVVAVDLLTHKQVFRHKVATHGLLNVVSAPDLSEASTYIAQRSPWGPPLRPDVPLVNQVALKTTMAELTTFQTRHAAPGGNADQQSDSQAVQMGMPDHTIHDAAIQTGQTGFGGVAGMGQLATAGDSTALSTANGDLPMSWSERWLDRPLYHSAGSGAWPSSMPRMDMKVKLTAMDRNMKRRESTPPVHLYLGKVSPELMRPAQKKLAEMPALWWDPEEQAKVSAAIADLEDNLSKIKPGVRNMFLIFSSRTTDVIWELPLYYQYYKDVLDPILEALLGRDTMKNIIRLQLAQMNPGAHIKPHKDSGPWAEASHRIHVVLKTNPSISFWSCPHCGSASKIGVDPRCSRPPTGTCESVDTSLNNVFEINNLMVHEVVNTANEDRVHMVVDVLETPAPERRVLQPGQRCHYVNTADQLNNPGC